MSRGLRNILLAVSALVAIGCGVALVVLNSGRPLFYTDGDAAYRADSLADRSMLVWDAPVTLLALPEGVRGRAARLADGRLVVARERSDGTADLAVWDPTRPQLEPVALSLVNAPRRQDLAPAIGADGVLYFASDRPSDVGGGFDLWASSPLDGDDAASFGPPRALDETFNSAADEFDPAPSPDGRSIVFARCANEGGSRLSELWLGHTSSDRGAERVFARADEPRRRPASRPLDRDPRFAPDGTALWFVRELSLPGSQPTVHRTWRHDGAFVAPVAEASLVGVRGPMPDANGFAVDLVAASVDRDASSGGPGPLLLRSYARELYPWWDGQAALEFALWIALLGALLLIALLLLGRRWRTFDIITWCLIVSALLHALILLLVEGLELTVDDLDLDGDGAGRLEVRLLSAEEAARAAGGAAATDGSMRTDVAAMAQFDGRAEHAERTPEAARQAELGATPQLPTPSAMERELSPLTSPSSAAATADLQLADASDAAQTAVREGRDAAVASSKRAAAAATATISNASMQSVPRNAQVTPLAAVGDVAQMQSGVVAPRARADDVLQRREAATLPAPRPAESAARPERVAVHAPLETASMRRSGQDARVVSSSRASPSAAVAAAEGVTLDAPQRSNAHDTASAAADRTAPVEGTAQSLRPAPRLRVVAAQSSDGRRQTMTVAEEAAGGKVPVAALRDGVMASATAGARGARADLRLDPSKAAMTDAAAGQSAPNVEVRRTTRSGSSVPDLPRATRRGAKAAPLAGLRLRRASRASLRPVRPLTRVAPGAPARGRTEVAPDVALRDARRDASSAAERASRLSARDPELAPSPSKSASGMMERAPIVAELSVPQRARQSVLSLSAPSVRPRLQALAPPPSRAHEGRASPMAAASRQNADPSIYRNRRGPEKRQALERFGGNAETERAVAAGLDYLASIQKRSGRWGSRRDRHEKYGDVRVGKTGLCVLAFLGANHTPKGPSQHAATVEKGVDALLAFQDEESGHFGATSSYGHGIATYALAECYALTRDPKLRTPLERAVAWIVEQQNRGRDARSSGGWGYFSPTLRSEDGFSRTSVSSWMIMALESARIGGIDVPKDRLDRAEGFLWRMFDPRQGWFSYNKEPGRLRSRWPTLPASTPAAAFCLLLLGADRGDERLETALNYTVERRPRRYRKASSDRFVKNGEGNVYFWYYGSLATFLADAGGGAGDSDRWDRWNGALQSTLLPAQQPDGSFVPIGAYADYAGDDSEDRSYTTAMCVLSLEVYYRYFTPLLRAR